jgi:two-component system sensor histidine kinase KdpD
VCDSRKPYPTAIFDQADDVELIDLPPSDLLARSARPARYTASRTRRRPAKRYFREPNLLALRELALRRTADRVDAAARAYKSRARFSNPGWPAIDSWWP